MKKLLVVLAILFIGILLAGCTSQPAAPVATPVPTAVPTTVVTTAIPTAEPTKEIIVVVVNKTANVTATPTPAPVPTYTITFTQDLTIVPGATAYVKVGTKVIWANMDPLKPHSIQANDIQTGQYFGGMGALEIPYRKTLEVTFDKVGAYDYTTGPFQPQTQGKIVVSA
ncbi:MAG: cupredoxin domain-containing protein [Methanoregula sp.]